MLILDVGCGFSPKGDVNTDLFITDKNGHRMQESNLKEIKISNFVLCDAQYLPFKSNTFNTVISYHVIEHVNNPQLMLKELIRVSNDEIKIKCPHRLSDKFVGLLGWRNSEHKYFFNMCWFRDYGIKYGCNVNTYQNVRSFIFLSLPLEIETFMKKKIFKDGNKS